MEQQTVTETDERMALIKRLKTVYMALSEEDQLEIIKKVRAKMKAGFNHSAAE
jgi:hypothetical protein